MTQICFNHISKYAKILFFIFFYSISLKAENYITFEGGALWQERNDQAVPGNTGTRFSVSDFNKGPFASYRIYIGWQLSDKHEVRFLYAPLELRVKGRFNNPVTFINRTFLANTETTAFYKFNSYRVTYSYRLEDFNDWNWAVGFTAKVRDAEVNLTQAAVTESKTNIGFVPLFHIKGKKEITADWFFRFDFDGLAAPQGRAIDLGLFIEKEITQAKTFAFAGYRTVEGGADNNQVYNFAWLNTLTLGLSTEL